MSPCPVIMCCCSLGPSTRAGEYLIARCRRLRFCAHAPHPGMTHICSSRLPTPSERSSGSKMHPYKGRIFCLRRRQMLPEFQTDRSVHFCVTPRIGIVEFIGQPHLFSITLRKYRMCFLFFSRRLYLAKPLRYGTAGFKLIYHATTQPSPTFHPPPR